MKNKRNRMIVLIFIIILILITAFLIFKLFDIKKNKNNIEPTSVNNVIENKIENNVIEENNDNNVEDNNTINTTIDTNNENNNQVVDKDEVDKETIKKEEDKKEKAVNIVKDNWGEDETVYFSFDSINSEGKYLVCVRDKSTTQALYWYTVNVETGTFEIE